MNKRFIRNLVLVFILITSLLLVCTISYSYISKQIIEDNINNNLEKILATSSDSILLKFEVDYNSYKTRIEGLTEYVTGSTNRERVENKLNILETYKEEILYESVNNGFGGFVEDDLTGDYYLINGITYQDENEADHNTSKNYNVIIADLGKDFKTGTGEANEFANETDSIYIIYHFGDIVIYVKAVDVLGPILSDLDLIEDYVIVNPDLGIRYATSKMSGSTLRIALGKEGNSDQYLVNIVFPQLDHITASEPYILIHSIKYHYKSCWVLISGLNKSEVTNNILLVIFIN